MDEWLAVSASCPTCRNSIYGGDPSVSVSAPDATGLGRGGETDAPSNRTPPALITVRDLPSYALEEKRGDLEDIPVGAR